MPGPVSSFNPYSDNVCLKDDESGAPPVPVQSTVGPEPPRAPASEGAGRADAGAGTSVLVQKFSPQTSPASAKLSASTAAPPSTGFMVTSSGAVPGGGSYRVAASLANPEVKSGLFKGTSAEAGTVSVQYGKDNDVQIVAARGKLAVSGGGYGLSVTGEAGVVRANLGENNDDGSIGGNIGSGAELIGSEATIDTPAGSVTAGLSASMSLSGSMGVRDADHDGLPEFCAKFSVPRFTIGACVEQFW
ncbi:MAG TPA: hypothetical protein VER11_11275 [Polyangiaceae bacterium]|nr:hypothetical protein [Polyangiaceae bacterium]